MRIVSFIVKEIKLLLRDPAGLLLLFVLPACFIIILSVSLQGTFSSVENTKSIDIVVIDNDKSLIGKTIVNFIKHSGIFNIISEEKGVEIDKQRALNYLKKGKYKIIVIIPEDAKETLSFVKDAVVEIIVDPVVSNDFVMHVTNAVQSAIHVILLDNLIDLNKKMLNNVKNEKLKEIEKQLIDAKNKREEIINMLESLKRLNFEGQVLSVIEELNKKYVEEFDNLITSLIKQRISVIKEFDKIEKIDYEKNILKIKQSYFSLEKDFIIPNSVQQNVPGWTIFALFWIAQIITINILSERDSGAFKRIFVSPITVLEFFIGKVTPFFIINLLQAFVMFSIGIYILPLFSLPPLEIKDFISVIIVTFVISFSAISFGLFIASVSKTLFIAASLSAILVILMTALGGIMIPKFIMPKFMQYMTYLVVHGWALDAYLNIFVRNLPLKENLLNILMIFIYGFVFFLVSVIKFNKNIKGK